MNLPLQWLRYPYGTLTLKKAFCWWPKVQYARISAKDVTPEASFAFMSVTRVHLSYLIVTDSMFWAYVLAN